MDIFKRLKVLVYGLVLCLLILFAPLFSYAQEIDLSLSPPVVEIIMKPGIALTLPFKIHNQGDPVSLTPLVQSFQISSDGKTIKYGPIERTPFRTRVSIDEGKNNGGFVLGKGETKELRLELGAPSNIATGDYHLSFMIVTQPEYADKEFAAKLKTRIAAPLLITVSKTGNREVKGALKNFSTGGGYTVPFSGNRVRIYDSAAEIPITLSITNEGRNFFETDGSIVLRGMFGEKALYPLQKQNVLAGTTRVQSPKTLKGFFLGRYALSALVSLSDGSVQLSDSVVFYAFPFKILFIALAGSVIGIMILKQKR